jgi:hypothetical protein
MVQARVLCDIRQGFIGAIHRLDKHLAHPVIGGCVVWIQLDRFSEFGFGGGEIADVGFVIASEGGVRFAQRRVDLERL